MSNLEKEGTRVPTTRNRAMRALGLSVHGDTTRTQSALELNGGQLSGAFPSVGTIFPNRSPDRHKKSKNSTKSNPRDLSNTALSWEEITAKAKALELKHNRRPPVLTREEEISRFTERDRFRDDKTPGTEALNAARVKELEEELLLSHLGIVFFFAERYAGNDADRDDLVQQAYFGLRRAIEKFKVEKGFSLVSFAEGKIRTHMMNVVRTQARTIRVPRRELESARNLIKIEQRLGSTLGRIPTTAELAAEAGCSKERVEVLLALRRPHKSLDVPIGHNGGATLHQYVVDPTDPSTEERALEFVDLELVEEMLAFLTPFEREIIKRRRGFRTGKPETRINISESLGITTDQLRKIEERAEQELRLTFDPVYAEAIAKRNELASLMPELYPTLAEADIVAAVPDELDRKFLRAYFIDEKTHGVIAAEYGCAQSTVCMHLKASIYRLTSLIDVVPAS